MIEKITKSDAAWRKVLSQEEYEVTRRKGTEAPFCGAFFDHKQDGTYHCVCCDLPLFSSDYKFISAMVRQAFSNP